MGEIGMSQLLLHCGAMETTYEDMVTADKNLPPSTRTYQPVEHGVIRSMVIDQLGCMGMEVEKERFGLSHNGARYFGLLHMKDRISDEVGLMIGIRNSHDKKIRAGVVGGERVFVCDNLCFSGEIAVMRKHTKNILRDMDDMLAAKLPELKCFQENSAHVIEAFQWAEINDENANDLLVRAARAGVIPSGHILKVANEWDNPTHEEFEPRTLWSLKNCVTHVLKERHPQDLFKRSMKLTGMLNRAFSQWMN